MLISLGADLEVDIATGGELKDGLDGVKKSVERSKPGAYLALAGTIPAAVSGVIRIGRPPEGRIWNILSLTITGNDDHTAVTGTSALYVDSDEANLSLPQLCVPNITVPYFQSFTKEAVWAHSTGYVCVNYQGAGVGVQLVAVLRVAEYREGDVAGRDTR